MGNKNLGKRGVRKVSSKWARSGSETENGDPSTPRSGHVTNNTAEINAQFEAINERLSMVTRFMELQTDIAKRGQAALEAGPAPRMIPEPPPATENAPQVNQRDVGGIIDDPEVAALLDKLPAPKGAALKALLQAAKKPKPHKDNRPRLTANMDKWRTPDEYVADLSARIIYFMGDSLASPYFELENGTLLAIFNDGARFKVIFDGPKQRIYTKTGSIKKNYYPASRKDAKA